MILIFVIFLWIDLFISFDVLIIFILFVIWWVVFFKYNLIFGCLNVNNEICGLMLVIIIFFLVLR